MKPERILTIILGVAVVVLAIICSSQRRRPLPQEPKEIRQTNTVEVWRTNTVERWRTNTMELWRTNTVLQVVTNEVVKEVPAKIPDAVQKAALLGYRHGNAPAIAGGSDALYKATPLSVLLRMNDSAKDFLSDGDADAIKKEMEGKLRSQSIPVANDSPYQLRLSLSALWTTDVPRRVLFMFRLELSEGALLLRQSDVVKGEAVSWNSTKLGTLSKDNLVQDLRDSIQTQLGQFCQDFAKTKDRQKAIESRLPAVPADFLTRSE